MDRQKGLVEYIYKLINSNFRYRKYKIHDKSFVVHFVYNLFYSMFKASYPRDRIQPIASKFHFNLVMTHKAKNTYYPSKKEKKIINVALFNYNEVEYEPSKLKDLVDLAQHYMEKFK